MTSIPALPRVHHVAGRTSGSGPLVAVLTDGPADVAVAAHAAELAVRTGSLLITAAATGFKPQRAAPRCSAPPHRERYARDRRPRSPPRRL